ncbi:MAG: type II toxin-antitoxin system RelE/ParE family toxin [Anaerolineae bacterium]|nr:type II toxin-antitoxin system RelE/ParE family toxin [Anaerolineae bacterium]
MPIEVVYADEFLRAARRLQKRYPHVMDDAETLADRLAAGERPGDRLQGLAYKAYKVRIKNRDAQRGKSGGYRVVYYLEIVEQDGGPRVVLVTIYSKSDQRDIPTETLRRLIADYEMQNAPKQ